MRTKNMLANLYIKLGLIIILMATFFVVYLVVSHTEITTQAETYGTYNSAGWYLGRGTRTERQSEALVVGAVAIVIEVVAGLATLFSRKYIVDFKKCYAPMRGLPTKEGGCFCSRFFLSTLAWIGCWQNAGGLAPSSFFFLH